MGTRLDLGDGTFVGVSGAQTRVRAGGLGGSAWLANLTGPDPKYGFVRQFVTAGLSGSRRSRVIRWEINSEGLYEWRDFCVGSTSGNWRSSGFCVIKNGEISEITRIEALDFVSSVTA